MRPGEAALDIGTGTGSVALAAAGQVGGTGRIVAIDISPDMLATDQARGIASSISNVDFIEGRCEAIPVPDQSQDAILASLSLMYVLDRASAAREIGRVLRPGGRLVGSVWAGPETADIVL